VTGSQPPAGSPASGIVQCVVLDCPDPGELAAFYAGILGGAVNKPDPRWAAGPDFATLHTAAGLVLAFQRVTGYLPPRWPGAASPQHCHLDIEVPDLDAAQAQVTAAGGTLLRADPRGWRVFADVAGHPFCLLPGHS
jgi:predicted enzyme related to lactoylglutathione lyase